MIQLWVFPQSVTGNSEKSKNVDFDMKTSSEGVLSGRIGVCAQKYVFRGVSIHSFNEKKKDQWLRLWRAPLSMWYKPTVIVNTIYSLLHTI